MRGKFLLIGLLALPLLFVSGCTDITSMRGEEVGEAAAVSIEVAPLVSGDIQSRAVGDGVISDMHILIYDSGDHLVSHGYAQSSSITMNTVSGSGYTIYAIANTGDSSLFGGTTASTIEKLKNLTTAALTSVDGIAPKNVLLMSGCLTGVTISGGGTMQTITGLSVARMAAKISLSVTAASGFAITGYAIKNLPQRSYYIARPNANENSASDVAVGDDTPFAGLDTPVTNTTSISNVIFYMYENRRGDRLSISGSQGDVTNQQQKAQYAPSNATYVEIYAMAGGYMATYRIYLGADNCRNYSVKRNSQYTYNVSITSANQIDSRVTLNEQSFALKYYMWDAPAAYVSNVQNYNTITSGVATNSCAKCPTYDQIQMYLGAGVYWDNTTKWRYTSTGADYTGGIWVKKKQYISGFDAGTATKATWTGPVVGMPSNTANYFFLPASGYNYYTPAAQGTGGRYWSSTPYSDGTRAYRLFFDRWGAFANDPDDRSAGFCLWTVQ